MANNRLEVLIKCPFYLDSDEKTVTCEGMRENTCMITKFRYVRAKRSHLKENCFRENGGACFMARALYEKYGVRPEFWEEYELKK